jgi:hypothetical protein
VVTDAGRRALDKLVEMTRPRVAPSPAQPADPYDDGGTALLGHSDFNVTLTQQALAWWSFPSVPGGGWRVVTEIVAPHLEADVAIRIAPKVRPHGVGRKTDRIGISGARTGTATAIHRVRFRSGMDRRDFDITSRETRSLYDMPLAGVCACRAQRKHRSNCRDGVNSHQSEPESQKLIHKFAPLLPRRL